MLRVARFVAIGAASLLLANGCSATTSVNGLATQAPPFGSLAPLRLDRGALLAKGLSPRVIAKVDGRAYHYFRLLSREYAARTCHAFADLRWRLPVVAIHGDAHIEQFVVTRDSYGLEDFDRAGFGPAVVDLVRYAASQHLACNESPWPCNADAAVSAFLDAYRSALDRAPTRQAPGPVGRFRMETSTATDKWLEWTDSLLRPLSAHEESTFRAGWPRFITLMKETRPELPARFFEIVKIGSIELGVGSAHETKVLVRTAGASAVSTDDVVLESRVAEQQVVPDSCVYYPSQGGSLHSLMFMSVLGPRIPQIYGFVPREGDPAAPEQWIQSWDSGYRELSVADVKDQVELDELARDAASQLAGHFWARMPESMRLHQRFAQLHAFDMVHQRARRLARELASETLTEWNRFRLAP